MAKALWTRLGPKVEAKPYALEAAKDLAANPNDKDQQAVLRVELKKLLAEDHALASDVTNIIGSVQQIETRGDGNLVAGRDIVIGQEAAREEPPPIPKNPLARILLALGLLLCVGGLGTFFVSGALVMIAPPSHDNGMPVGIGLLAFFFGFASLIGGSILGQLTTKKEREN